MNGGSGSDASLFDWRTKWMSAALVHEYAAREILRDRSLPTAISLALRGRSIWSSPMTETTDPDEHLGLPRMI